jgi:integrase
MCYKNEKQNRENIKLEEKIKDMPTFIKEYFVYLSSSASKINQWCTIRKILEWSISQNIIAHKLEEITCEDLNRIREVDIIRYLDGLKTGLYGDKNSKTTINTKKNILSGFWSYLSDNDCVTKNIITKRISDKYIIKQPKEVSVPTDDDINKLLINLSNIKNEMVSIRNIAIVKLFKGSGLRIEELVGLDMEDLDFEGKQKFVWVMEKGEYTDKVKVAINREAYDAISDYIKIRNLNPDWEYLNPLFISERKDKITRENLRLSQSSIEAFFYNYSDKKIHPHMIRHYVGTMIYRNEKGSIEMASDQLRHKDINTTRKYYIQEDKQAKYDVIDTI